MTRYKIVLSKRAKEDLIEIGDYISYKLLAPETAQKFVRALKKEISKLKEMPQRYAFVDDPIIASQGVRCLPYKNYYVFF